MAVEILTVSLSEETIGELARQVAWLLQKDGATTQSNPPSPQNSQPAERSGFQQGGRAPQQDDGWSSEPRQRRDEPQNDQEGPPTCKCGDGMRWVPPGYSEAKGKAYKGFWACPRPRGQQCPR